MLYFKWLWIHATKCIPTPHSWCIVACIYSCYHFQVVDLGYNDMSFIKYLKEVQGIRCILGVDLENIPLRCSLDLIGCEDHVPKRENPLEVTVSNKSLEKEWYTAVVLSHSPLLRTSMIFHWFFIRSKKLAFGKLL